jgi:glycosyltransferase involved in cell wall biosynthesis
MLNNEYPPLGGGTGTVNQAILQRLARDARLEIDLITSAENEQGETIHLSPTVRIFKLPVRRHNIHHASNGELIRYFWRTLALALQLQKVHAYDVCWAWSAVPAGGVAYALRWMAGLRYIVRVCGPDIPGFEDRYRRLYWFLTPLIRAIWRSAAIVVAKCAGEAEMIRRVEPRLIIKLIPNGVDLERFIPVDHHHDGALQILCVGRLIERKGQRFVIEAIHKLQQRGVPAELNLVGLGDAESEYRGLAERLGVTKVVNFLGYIPREDIPNIYAQSDVFVLASYNEGMSVATLEAMASGLPVIVSRTGGTQELVLEDLNGWSFNWGETDRLTSLLEQLALNPPLLSNMREQARSHAERFTWEAACGSYMELLGSFNPG